MMKTLTMEAEMDIFTRTEAQDDAALLAHFFACEKADFLWAARREERWLGTYESLDDYDLDHDRVAIRGRLNGTWFAAIVVVDGNGAVEELLRRGDFDDEQAAVAAYHALH